MAPKKPGRMKRLAEGVYERDGRIVVKWWQPNGDGKGKRLQKTMSLGTTVAQAKAFKGKMEDEKLRRRVQMEETVESFAERWTRDYPRAEPATNYYNAERTRTIGEDFKGRRLSSITREEAYAWARANPARTKAATTMFSQAESLGLLGEKQSPFRSLRLPQSKGRKGDRITILTAEEIDQLADVARAGFGEYGKVAGAMIVFAAWTGLRPGELYALEWSDIDFENKTINVERAVKSKARSVGSLKTEAGLRKSALLPKAEEALRSIPRVKDQPLIFYGLRGGRLYARIHSQWWLPVRLAFWNALPADRRRRISKAFTFYELRHTFGTYLARRGATPYDIAKQMGHADGGRLAMRLYIHTEQDESNERILGLFNDEDGQLEATG